MMIPAGKGAPASTAESLSLSDTDAQNHRAPAKVAIEQWPVASREDGRPDGPWPRRTKPVSCKDSRMNRGIGNREQKTDRRATKPVAWQDGRRTLDVGLRILNFGF